jgi:hypothetical protein
MLGKRMNYKISKWVIFLVKENGLIFQWGKNVNAIYPSLQKFLIQKF